MKDLIKLTILSLFLFVGIRAMSQTFEIKTGMNMSTMLFTNQGRTYSEDFKITPRFLSGMTTERPISESFSFETGILFSSKGYKVDIKNYGMFQLGESFDLYENAVLNYIDIPLSIKYSIDIRKVKLHGALGPYMGIGITGKISNKEYANDGQGGVDYLGIIEYAERMGSDGLWKRFDYGLQAGVGLEINRFVARVNYSHGIANISRVSGSTNKNRVLAVSLGYIVNLKR